MADNKAFHSVLTMEDLASAVVGKVGSNLKRLGAEAAVAAHELAGVEQPGMWSRFGEHVSLAKDHVTELAGGAREATLAFSELLAPALALGTLGSVQGLFERVSHAAEAFGQLSRGAAELGMSSPQLQEWNAVAKLTDMDAERLSKSMYRLNVTFADAARGHNKDAAKLLQQLQINPRDYNNAADALGPLADAYKNTTKETVRAAMVAALFGARVGKEMAPLLAKGSAGVLELRRRARELNVDLSPFGEGLENYNYSMNELSLATDGFSNELAGALAPALRPVIDSTREWIVANRDWLSQDIGKGVRTLANDIKDGNFVGFGGTLQDWAGYAHSLAAGLSHADDALNELANIHPRQTKDELRNNIWWQRGKSQADIDYAISMAPDSHDEPRPLHDTLRQAIRDYVPGPVLRFLQDGLSEPGDQLHIADDLPAAQIDASRSGDLSLRDQIAANRHFFGTPFGAAPDGIDRAAVNTEFRRQHGTAWETPTLPESQVFSQGTGFEAATPWSIPRLEPVPSIARTSSVPRPEAPPPGKVEVTVRFANEPASMATSAVASGNVVIRVERGENSGKAFWDHYGP